MEGVQEKSYFNWRVKHYAFKHTHCYLPPFTPSSSWRTFLQFLVKLTSSAKSNVFLKDLVALLRQKRTSVHLVIHITFVFLQFQVCVWCNSFPKILTVDIFSSPSISFKLTPDTIYWVTLSPRKRWVKKKVDVEKIRFISFPLWAMESKCYLHLNSCWRKSSSAFSLWAFLGASWEPQCITWDRALYSFCFALQQAEFACVAR